jgi:parvulin-like peptidyl-prolyl isomerase
MSRDASSRLESRNPRRSLALLVLGLFGGLALTAAGVLGDGAPARLPDGAVAAVNGKPIAQETYERVLAGLDEDKREGVTDDDRRHVLDRLIDEELLVQHALDLDLIRNDLRLRGDLARTMIASAIAQAAILEPSAAELERFFADNATAFAGPGRLRVRRVFVAAEPVRGGVEAERRARGAAERLRAGEQFETVDAALGDRAAAALPDSLLTLQELRGYLGPTAARTASELRDSEVSDPIRSAAGFQVLQIIAREAAVVPALGAVEDAVRAEWRRREEEKALRAYLDDLRASASVTIGGP